MRASTLPLVTVSPSRTVTVSSSPATLDLTVACTTGISEPDSGSTRDNGLLCTTATSAGASSVGGAAGLASSILALPSPQALSTHSAAANSSTCKDDRGFAALGRRVLADTDMGLP